MNRHFILLGDSILDNGAYTGIGPDVATQLRDLVGPGEKVTLLAVDGDKTADVPRQLQNLPATATHLVLSVGGNDALDHAGILQESASSVGEVLGRLARIVQTFAVAHRSVLEQLAATDLPLMICTVYDANFSEPGHAILVRAALDCGTTLSFATPSPWARPCSICEYFARCPRITPTTSSRLLSAGKNCNGD